MENHQLFYLIGSIAIIMSVVVEDFFSTFLLFVYGIGMILISLFSLYSNNFYDKEMLRLGHKKELIFLEVLLNINTNLEKAINRKNGKKKTLRE